MGGGWGERKPRREAAAARLGGAKGVLAGADAVVGGLVDEDAALDVLEHVGALDHLRGVGEVRGKRSQLAEGGARQEESGDSPLRA